MTRVLSVDDLFTVGVGFDLLGGYFLGRGLLASPQDVVRRTTPLWGAGNPAEVVSQLGSRADGLIGLALLGLGFALQAGGYLALIGGAEVQTGVVRALLAAAMMAASALVALGLGRWIHGRLLRRLVRDAARVEPASGRMAEYPDGKTLLLLG